MRSMIELSFSGGYTLSLMPRGRPTRSLLYVLRTPFPFELSNTFFSPISNELLFIDSAVSYCSASFRDSSILTVFF